MNSKLPCLHFRTPTSMAHLAEGKAVVHARETRRVDRNQAMIWRIRGNQHSNLETPGDLAPHHPFLIARSAIHVAPTFPTNFSKRIEPVWTRPRSSMVLKDSKAPLDAAVLAFSSRTSKVYILFNINRSDHDFRSLQPFNTKKMLYHARNILSNFRLCHNLLLCIVPKLSFATVTSRGWVGQKPIQVIYAQCNQRRLSMPVTKLCSSSHLFQRKFRILTNMCTLLFLVEKLEVISTSVNPCA